MGLYQKSVLDNGIRVVTEVIPNLESISLGIWITTGSRDEEARENGLSHFIEHLLFKGTKRRSAFDISREIESVGGSINAFTGKEYTCLHAKVLHKDVVLAIDILADILANSVFDPQEIERERMVVLQEIKMVEDTPDDYIHDLFHRSFWGDHPLGYPVAGAQENVLSFQRDQIVTFFQENYTPDKLIVAAAGRLDHQQMVRMVEAQLGHLKPGRSMAKREGTQGGKVRIKVKYRDLEQIHFCLGTKGIHYGHSLRFAGHALNTMLGGNMSSRLFQEIREKRGLAYSIYSFLNTYTDTGLFGVYAGTTKDEVQEVVALILQELKAIRAGRIRTEDLLAAKEYLRGGMILSLEGSEGRMSRLAKNEIYFSRHIPLEEALQELGGVSEEGIAYVAHEMLDSRTLCLTLLGTIEEGELPWKGLDL
ncbi:MAG: insulinase family protein [Deltaproteobacteria bacterium]|nr:insulinase family protein [Deltaproteobacteria bacterium]